MKSMRNRKSLLSSILLTVETFIADKTIWESIRQRVAVMQKIERDHQANRLFFLEKGVDFYIKGVGF